MDLRFRALALAAAAACLLGTGGCVTTPTAPEPAPVPFGVLRALALDRALEDRILALDPVRITEDDVRTTLAAAPAPRIILVHGGIYPVHLAMMSFGYFLTGMGYPEAQIRDPGDQSWSYSPYQDSAQIAGLVAWAYERDGLRPMLIGHSQGGIHAVKVLNELDGAFADRISVWDPIRGAAEDRTTIVDPLTGAVRPVRGLSASYASGVAAGGAAMLLPHQWKMVGRLRTIPDTVDEFTGYSIGLDFFAFSVPGAEKADHYQHNGKVQVRNVALPAWYNHVAMPVSHDLPDDPVARLWISAYVPGETTTPAPLQDAGRSVLWAADVWHSVRKHWCLELQRLVRARRAIVGGG